MHWILQSNLYDESAFTELLHQLDRQQTTYDIVKVIPFAHTLDKEVMTNDNVFVCGATSLGNIAKNNGWVPGYFDKNLDMGIVSAAYGNEMLNAGLVVSKLKDVMPLWEQFFIRPCSDKKEFAGQTMSALEFAEWQQKILKLDGTSSWTSLTGEDKVMIAPLRTIHSEYRFFVVDGQVVTGSMYKRGSQVFYSSHVDPEIYDYAQQRVNQWQPDRAFCLDVAITEDGYKVIEINSINSSGFYALDMGKYVNAINSMRNFDNELD